MGPEETYQITRSENRADPDKIEIEKLIKSYNRSYLPKRNNYNSRDFSCAKQTDTETPEDNWEILIEPEKELNFPDCSTELFISKITTSSTDRKLRDKLLKEKDLDVPKVVDQIQQNTYDRKNKKNTIPEALISNREKHLRRAHTQNNTHRTVRNKTERETKRSKLQILQRTKLESEPQMSSPRSNMPHL